MWISCAVYAGTHNARLGGTIHTRRAVRTRIVPSTAKTNCARACQCGVMWWPGR
ncbi:hypothetical protein D3C83_12720 [compost metagenome]